MKRCGFLMALVLFGIAAHAEAGVIITSIERLWQIDSETQHSSCSDVAMIMRHANEAGQIAQLAVGLAPIEDFPVIVELNESTSGNTFGAFVTRLSDGQNGDVTFRPRMLCDLGTEFFTPSTESEFSLFGNESDLLGYDIELIRFYFLNADLDLTSGVDGSFRARLEFVGQPIPEPSTLGVAFLGATAFSGVRSQRQGGLR